MIEAQPAPPVEGAETAFAARLEVREPADAPVVPVEHAVRPERPAGDRKAEVRLAAGRDFARNEPESGETPRIQAVRAPEQVLERRDRNRAEEVPVRAAEPTQTSDPVVSESVAVRVAPVGEAAPVAAPAAPAPEPVRVEAARVEAPLQVAEVRPAGQASQAREITVRVAAPEPVQGVEAAPMKPVDLVLQERDGRVQVAVRTPDQGLAGEMQRSIGDLVERLESVGYRTEAWTPEAGSGIDLAPLAARGDAEFADERGRGRGGDAQDARNQQQQYQEDKRRRPQWVEELEKSFTTQAGR
ncbi:MAG: hypothetical protein FJW40_00495 [Acidobacteria bacterium]|nr:hypothetical protein [Acidobacteriota bacterium]